MKFINYILELFKDRNFLKIIHVIENIVSKFLSMALIVVIIISVWDLILVLIKDLFFTEPIGFFDTTLIEIFGFFLNILIALELLENVTVYLKKHVVQLELVLTTALIAVARKIIVFNSEKYDKNYLIALGIGVLCLSASYWLIRQINSKNNNNNNMK